MVSRGKGIRTKTNASSKNTIYRGSNMSAHVLLNLLYELGERDNLISFSQRVY